MLDHLLSALNYGASSLDKLGPRPLKGLLAGKPREAMSLIPFSDAMGLTDERDSTSGRDLLDKWGATDKHDDGWGSSIAGMGLDMALDPLAAAGVGLGGVKLAGRLSHALPPGSPVHHLMSLLGDSDAAAKAAMTPTMRQARGGFLSLKPFPGKSRAINAAADYVGPRFDDPEALGMLRDAISSGKSPDLIRKFADNPMQSRIASEIPHGSSVLDSGGQALVLRAPGTRQAPDGWAIRIAPSVDLLGSSSGEDFFRHTKGMAPIAGRPRIPEMLAPFRSNEFAAAGGMAHHGLRVEHLPLVDPLNKSNMEWADQLPQAITRASGSQLASEIPYVIERKGMIDGIDEGMMQHLRRAIEGRMPKGFEPEPGEAFYNPFDIKLRNLGHVPGQPGRIAIHDGGAVGSRWSSVLPYGSPQPDFDVVQALGGHAPEAVQRVLSQAAGPRAPLQGIPYPGALQIPGGRTVLDPWDARRKSVEFLLDFIRRSGVPRQAQAFVGRPSPVTASL